jgi:hypothetical protein
MSLTGVAFLTIYLLALILAFVKHPLYGLGAYLWSFYLHPPTSWWGADLPDFRWSLTAAIITLLSVLIKPPSNGLKWRQNLATPILIGYVSWMWIQTFWAVDPVRHFEGCLLFTKYVILFYIIYRVIADLKTLESFSFIHIVGCLIFGWIAFTTNVSGRLDSVGGPGMDDANLLAMHQITGAAFAGFLFLGIKGKKRWIALFTIPFILNTIILTESRGALVGLVGAALAALIFSPREKRRITYGAMSLGIILFLWLSNAPFWTRMETLAETNEIAMEASARSRIELVRYDLEIAADFPLGSGYGGHQALSAKYLPDYLLSVNQKGERVRSAHNTLMAILVEQGIPGVILYISLIGWSLINLFKLKSSFRKDDKTLFPYFVAATGTSLMAVVICSQFISAMNAEIQIWLISLLAVMISLNNTQQTSICESNSQKMVEVV